METGKSDTAGLDWSTLPQLLLCCIVEYVDDVLDLASMRLTCLWWKESVTRSSQVWRIWDPLSQSNWQYLCRRLYMLCPDMKRLALVVSNRTTRGTLLAMFEDLHRWQRLREIVLVAIRPVASRWLRSSFDSTALAGLSSVRGLQALVMEGCDTQMVIDGALSCTQLTKLVIRSRRSPLSIPCRINNHFLSLLTVSERSISAAAAGVGGGSAGPPRNGLRHLEFDADAHLDGAASVMALLDNEVPSSTVTSDRVNALLEVLPFLEHLDIRRVAVHAPVIQGPLAQLTNLTELRIGIQDGQDGAEWTALSALGALNALAPPAAGSPWRSSSPTLLAAEPPGLPQQQQQREHATGSRPHKTATMAFEGNPLSGPLPRPCLPMLHLYVSRVTKSGPTNLLDAMLPLVPRLRTLFMTHRSLHPVHLFFVGKLTSLECLGLSFAVQSPDSAADHASGAGRARGQRVRSASQLPGAALQQLLTSTQLASSNPQQLRVLGALMACVERGDVDPDTDPDVDSDDADADLQMADVDFGAKVQGIGLGALCRLTQLRELHLKGPQRLVGMAGRGPANLHASLPSQLPSVEYEDIMQDGAEREDAPDGSGEQGMEMEMKMDVGFILYLQRAAAGGRMAARDGGNSGTGIGRWTTAGHGGGAVDTTLGAAAAAGAAAAIPHSVSGLYAGMAASVRRENGEDMSMAAGVLPPLLPLPFPRPLQAAQKDLTQDRQVLRRAVLSLWQSDIAALRTHGSALEALTLYYINMPPTVVTELTSALPQLRRLGLRWANDQDVALGKRPCICGGISMCGAAAAAGISSIADGNRRGSLKIATLPPRLESLELGGPVKLLVASPYLGGPCGSRQAPGPVWTHLRRLTLGKGIDLSCAALPALLARTPQITELQLLKPRGLEPADLASLKPLNRLRSLVVNFAPADMVCQEVRRAMARGISCVAGLTALQELRWDVPDPFRRKRRLLPACRVDDVGLMDHNVELCQQLSTLMDLHRLSLLSLPSCRHLSTRELSALVFLPRVEVTP
ncbi:hypothetical protein Vretifemale_18921 [Volvox reticuliferus]|nr:hypothetical protein Vretifemale_18921 [Volvox reticuliferus]